MTLLSSVQLLSRVPLQERAFQWMELRLLGHVLAGRGLSAP
jgi:hypothetical protein